MSNANEMAYNACGAIRFESSLENVPLVLVGNQRVGQIMPQDGGHGGYLYMSSRDCFAQWEVLTTQDRVNVTTARRTGPASWSRVWLSSGCQINCRVFDTSIERVNQSTGLIEAGVPQPEIRWWWYPYSVDQAWETLQFSLGSSVWDSFPTLAAGTSQILGYPPRFCRQLFVNGRTPTNLTARFYVNGAGYGQVDWNDQASFHTDAWTKVELINAAAAPTGVLCSWSCVPAGITNP